MPLTERLSSRVAAEALALAGSEPRGVPAVIDTNVVLDLIYWEDPHSEDLRRALEEGRIHALRSGEAVMELAEVLSRPAFTGDEDEAARLAALWCSMSVPVDEEKIREAADVITVQCRDPLDQKFFTLTLAGGAKLLVSKDKLVLKAGRKMQRYGACAFRPEETACTGASQVGNAPAKCSIRIPMKRSIEPNTTRWIMIGRCFSPSAPTYSSSKR